jgi:hypothetical protein
MRFQGEATYVVISEEVDNHDIGQDNWRKHKVKNTGKKKALLQFLAQQTPTV